MIDRIERRLIDRGAIFAQRDPHSTVLERTVGALTPGEALRLAPASGDAGLPARQAAMRGVSDRIGAPLTPDQTTAVR